MTPPPAGQADALHAGAQRGGAPGLQGLHDLHDLRHGRLKAALLALWALVAFGASWFARDLQALVWRGWPLGYWIAAQGALLVFIAIVAIYAWAMNRFERSAGAAPAPPAPDPAARPPRPGKGQRPDG